MRASLWPIVFMFLFLLIVSRVMPRSTNPPNGENLADTASTELVTADHSLYNEQTIENSVFHGKVMGYIEYEGFGFRISEKSSSVEAGRTRTKRHVGDEGEVEKASSCMEQEVGSGSVRKFRLLENTTSFDNYCKAQLEDQPVAVQVSQVNGNFTLPLLCLFINHTQDLSVLECPANCTCDPETETVNFSSTDWIVRVCVWTGAAGKSSDMTNRMRVFKVQSCLKPGYQEDFFMIMVGILIVVCLVVLVIHSVCQKSTPKVTDVLGSPPAVIDATSKRRYNVYIAHSWQDNEMVKADLVDPLSALGYSVAWKENAFPPGDYIDTCIEKAVTTSSRMLVVASKSFKTFPYGKQIIQRGLLEERSVPGFKVMALVMDNLQNDLYNDLYEIIVKRVHVLRSDSNYLRKVQDFLPTPVPSQRIFIFTETDLPNFLCRQNEIIQRRENQRVHLQEVFPLQKLDHHGSPVSTSNALQSENEIGTPMTDDIWKAVFSRSHGKLVSIPNSEQPHTFSYYYTIKEDNEGEEHHAQIEAFSREKIERHSSKF